MQFLELFLIVAGVVCLGLTVYLGMKQPQNEPVPLTPNEPSPDLANENAERLQSSLTELVNELHTMSRDMTEDLDQKLTELKDLLQLADAKLEELARSDSGRRDAAAFSVESPSGIEIPVKLPDPEPEIITPEEPEPQEPPAPPPNRYQQIYEMADEHLSIEEIARKIQMGKGEIQLILSLRKKD